MEGGAVRQSPDVTDALHAVRWMNDMKQSVIGSNGAAPTSTLSSIAAASAAAGSGASAIAPAPVSTLTSLKRSVLSWFGGGSSPPASFAPVMRVNQLDAELLDSDLTQMLSYQLSRIGQFVSPQVWSAFKPELDALLQVLIFRFTILRDVPTPGNKLSNLRYANATAPAPTTILPPLAASSPVATAATALATATAATGMAAAKVLSDGLTARQKWLYALLWIGGRYGWTRLNQYMLHNGFGHFPAGDWHERLYRFCRAVETAYRALSIANFALFLWNGRYRSLLDRVLSMRLVYAHGKVVRQVTFDFMNQQLIWHGFSEFLLFILPLINFERIRALLRRMFHSTPAGSAAAAGGAAAGAAGGSGGAAVADLLNSSCPVCSLSPITVPYRAEPCGHLFCYYCLAGSRTADRNYRCARCDQTVTSQHPLQYA